MLKLGTQGIAAVYVGGQKITKAYLGDSLVFGASAPPEPVTYTISLSVDPQGGGTVTGGGPVEEGAQVTVTAIEAGGYTFSGWRENGAIVSTSASYSFTVIGDRSLTAVFAAVIPSYTVTTSIDPAGSGTAAGAGTYQQGASVTVTASPGDGYKFVKWTENGQTVSETDSYTFTVSGDRALVAVFEVDKPSRLPAGYTEVEYVQGGANSNINYMPCIQMPTISTAVKFEIKYQAQQTGSNIPYALYGYDSSTSSSNLSYYKLMHIRNYENGGYVNRLAYNYGSNSSRCIGPVVTANQVYDCILDSTNKKFIVNGEEFTGTTNKSWRTDSNYLFKTFSGSYGPSMATMPNLKVFLIKMWDAAGDLVLNMVPCISPSGIVGMYDTVKGVLYKNVNTSTNSANKFTAGPAV